jgi:NAD(P)-dependent dehydrogenase (short-subunit alcohol dehydrogenase family)
MFDAVIGVNVKGVFLGLHHVLPVMLQQKRVRSSVQSIVLLVLLLLPLD